MEKTNQHLILASAHLSRNIFILREQLMQCAKQNGMNHPETIRQSQLLDKLIYEYQLGMLAQSKDGSFHD
ncbi:aspartyl-phosphate phosphatase Spo0E family protein [Weizmannia sp. FSL K6-3076]|uniref:aspartyl-phosphate phosphatase Spo0E family protein n=1 Tax=Weizmannia sp. FSL K6-3076 TaxID=2954542 RepID=UPI0030F55A96